MLGKVRQHEAENSQAEHGTDSGVTPTKRSYHKFKSVIKITRQAHIKHRDAFYFLPSRHSSPVQNAYSAKRRACSLRLLQF